jgi:hypothetical protein
MRYVLVPAALALLATVAAAKLPPPSDAAKAKQAETAAKAAWQAKVDNYELCKAQDRIAAAYRKSAGNGAAAAKPPASTPAKAPASAAVAAKSPASTASASPASTGTPVAAAPPPPCSDPGPFASNAPEQKPLETSEAHSPAGTAASPPSEKAHSGQIQPPQKKP